MTAMGPSRVAQNVSFPCRLLGHAWEPFSPETHSGPWRHALHLKCLRCGMTRHDGFNSAGELDVRRYDAPEGYYLKGDEERPSITELRLWALKRQRRLAFTPTNSER